MSKKEANFVKYIFIGLCILELLFRVLDMPELGKYTKPLLIPALMVYFKRSMHSPLNLSFMLAFLAMIFSWVGDVMLIYENSDEMYFLMGVAGFAVAQLLYIFAFSKARNESNPSSENHQLPFYYSVPFVIIAGFLMWKLVPVAGGMAVPICVYALLLLGMVVSSVFRIDRSSQASFNQLFFGAVLFMLSDTLLAFNKFLMPMENAGFFVMITYLLAQWNIANGLLKHYNESN